MKRFIIFSILIFLIVSVCYAKSNHNKKLKLLKPRCIMGYLYYDWVGRYKYDSIPVLDSNGKMVKCNNECEE